MRTSCRAERLLNGGYLTSDFRHFRPQVDELNTGFTFKMAVFLAAIFAVGSLLSFITGSPMVDGLDYLLYTVCFTAFALVARFPLRKHPRASLVVVYLFVSFVFLLSANFGIWQSPEDITVLFFGLLIAFAVIFTDLVWRSTLFMVAWCALICALAFVEKPLAVAYNDLFHAIFFLFLAVYLNWETGKTKVLSIVYRDKVEGQRNMDSLTHLPSRFLFDEEVRNFDDNPERDLPHGVIAIDVDLFKPYNDTYGHPAGDECLHSVASVIRHVAREHDIFFARNGGEEFTGLVYDDSDIPAIAEKLRTGIEELKMPHSGSPIGHVTISVGYALCEDTEPARDIHTLISCADKALYSAKLTGRDRCVAWGGKEMVSAIL